MRRPALYSSSRRHQQPPEAPPEASQAAPQTAGPVARSRPRFDPSSPRVLWAVIAVMLALLAFSLTLSLRHGPRAISQEDIDKAVLKTMETQTLPSEYARAYDNVRPAVVRVRAT